MRERDGNGRHAAGMMRLLPALRAILTPAQRRAILLMQAVSLLMALATTGGIAAIAPFFAVLGEPALIERNPALRWAYHAGGFTAPRPFLVALGIGFVAVVVLANLVSVLGFLAMHRLALRIGTELQTALFGEYLSRPYAFHTATSSTTLLNSVLYETTRITHGILEHGFVLVANLVTAALIVVSIVLVQPLIAGGATAVLLGAYTLIYLGVRAPLLRAGQRQSRLGAEQARVVSESFAAIKEIIVLQAQGFFRARFARVSHAYLHAATYTQLVGHSPRYLLECLAAAGLVGVALLLGARAGGPGSWLGPLTFLAFAAYRLLPTMQQLFAAVVRIRADSAAIERIGPDLARARAVKPTPPAPQLQREWHGRPAEVIELVRVSYRYAPERAWAVHEVSLRIPALTTVALVGANGSGKSTLMDLMAGLLVPDLGVVQIDGCALDEHNRTAWQARIACVPQSICLLDASIAHNIALGVAPEAIDRRRLVAAARLARLHELVMRLPEHYQQRVGERGIALSGGERQRIGIARALYREARVLLLDEATSALDGLTEQELLATLAALHGRCTIVLIAHRLTTVRACDQIFQLEDGRIVGSGNYERLLGSSAAFRRLAGVH